jgi:hypothetical protein
MAEPEDAITPILRNIQSELAEAKRDLSDGFAGMRTEFRTLTERMEAFEGYFTFTMGVTSQNKADIEQLRQDVDIKQRLSRLEGTER